MPGTPSAVAVGSAGTWKAGLAGDISVIIVGGTWYAAYDAEGTDNVWRTGLASSTDGAGNVWTDYGSNPIIQQGGGGNGSCGGSFLWAGTDGKFYDWVHCAPYGAAGNLPSQMYLFASPSLSSPAFTEVSTTPLLQSMTADEGLGFPATSQVADPYLVQANNHTYMFYEGLKDGTGGGTASNSWNLKLAIVDVPMSTLIQRAEVDGASVSVGRCWKLMATRTARKQF